MTHGGGQELEEPLVIRPTSEAVIWNTYRNWIQSYRDLPLLYNQWCNVVRWEMRTRLFLRTSEFLWQEGHTAHARPRRRRRRAADARGLPRGRRGRARDPRPDRAQVAVGAVPRRGRDLHDRGPDAGPARRSSAGRRHFLGQNFAKAYDVQFLNQEGELEYAWATSWGFSTRMIGGVIMTHGDDRGLRLPPALAPVQVVIVPIYKTDEERGSVLEVANKVKDELAGNADPGEGRRPRPAPPRLQVQRVGVEGRARCGSRSGRATSRRARS